MKSIFRSSTVAPKSPKTSSKVERGICARKREDESRNVRVARVFEESDWWKNRIRTKGTHGMLSSFSSMISNRKRSKCASLLMNIHLIYFSIHFISFFPLPSVLWSSRKLKMRFLSYFNRSQKISWIGKSPKERYGLIRARLLDFVLYKNAVALLLCVT